MRLVALVLAAVVGSAAIMQMDQPGTPTGTSFPAADMSRPAEIPAATPGQRVDAVEPAAACRMRPECSANSDCDERCGVGQGKCVHSSCPVRICRCS